MAIFIYHILSRVYIVCTCIEPNQVRPSASTRLTKHVPTFKFIIFLVKRIRDMRLVNLPDKLYDLI